MQSETTGIEPHTTDDESTTNNRCHSGAGAEADGGVRWFDLNSSNRDLLVEIYQMDHPSGQAIRHRMQAEHGEDVTTTRLYSNLNDLVDHGLLDKGEQDQRTNSYEVTNDGRRLVEDTARYFASIGATNPVDADGGREQTAVDVKVLEGRVETLSKGLAATRESIDELKDDLEAERQERRRLEEENDELREDIERLDARTDLLKPDQTRRVLDPPELHFWQTSDHVVDGGREQTAVDVEELEVKDEDDVRTDGGEDCEEADRC